MFLVLLASRETCDHHGVQGEPAAFYLCPSSAWSMVHCWHKPASLTSRTGTCILACGQRCPASAGQEATKVRGGSLLRNRSPACASVFQPILHLPLHIHVFPIPAPGTSSSSLRRSNLSEMPQPIPILYLGASVCMDLGLITLGTKSACNREAFQNRSPVHTDRAMTSINSDTGKVPSCGDS